MNFNHQKSEEYLVNFYKRTDNLKNDFRNYNLNHLINRQVEGESVLDIGCGNGFLLSLLSKNRKKIYGIEPNKKLIKLAKEINSRLHIYEGFGEDIDKLITDKMDCILMIDVLEHIENDDMQIQKTYKHLKKAGQFIVVVPAYQFLYGQRDKNNGHYKRYSKKEICLKLSKGGFRVKSVRHWNMLGFFLYLFYEKVLKKELNTELRTKHKKGFVKNLINRVLNLWFKYIENNFNLGFGLSIICIAKK